MQTTSWRSMILSSKAPIPAAVNAADIGHILDIILSLRLFLGWCQGPFTLLLMPIAALPVTSNQDIVGKPPRLEEEVNDILVLDIVLKSHCHSSTHRLCHIHNRYGGCSLVDYIGIQFSSNVIICCQKVHLMDSGTCHILNSIEFQWSQVGMHTDLLLAANM